MIIIFIKTKKVSRVSIFIYKIKLKSKTFYTEIFLNILNKLKNKFNKLSAKHKGIFTKFNFQQILLVK